MEKNQSTELDTFLPGEKNGTKHDVVYMYPNSSEAAKALNGEFDPFKARDLEHPVSDCDTLTHLLKASLGTGILAMGAAFQAAGLVVGIFATIAVAIVCTHCSYVLVVCAHDLYKRTKKTKMSFAEIAEEACKRGPKWSRNLGFWAKQIILQGLFITYFTTCSCYSVIIAKNFEQVLTHYQLKFSDNDDTNLRLIIVTLLIPLILQAYVPNLKYLAPVSMVANVFMGLGLGITFYYLVSDIPQISERRLASPITTLPISLAITIFAIEAIGVVMPLENNMKTPKNFVGICGVLNQGMSGVTLIYILLGFLGYLKYGDDVLGSVTLNLPEDEYLAQAVKILIGLAVFFTFGLQFYVCLDIAWTGVQHRFQNKPLLANYILRTVMVIICIALAIAVPTITPFVGLIGAFCFSIVGLMMPVFIETVTFWDKGFGKFNWKILKNTIVVIFALLALIFGSKSAIEDIINVYTKAPSVTVASLLNESSIANTTTF
ncbi:proton-coupled amino acid transporter-like protein pathetic [Onthophagus taurus]|uniref:proton-coupled amino acid transporter-like protein pathetic n=1 Tax=Onthophagus taurus TaxID=166361 RepID=UPI000C204202|nr:proton-coupled amino acid transporter-like protein pathetic [Onthophagus taurus]XP_022915784.1 proton-coupled amino acid transporter-like protein pathetic [Onthophagus taurus]